jgi:hypothetical protein
MDKARWDRLAAAGGIVGVALFVVAAIVYGSPPTVGDDSQTVASFFADHRDRVLSAIFLQGLGVLAVLWFLAALVNTMREAGEARLAAAAFGSFLLAFAFGGIGAVTRATLAYSVADEGGDLVRPLYHLAAVLDVFANLLGAGLLVAVGAAALRTGLFARWWAWISVLAGVVSVIGSTAWARDGFWSPTGGVTFVCFVVFLGWILVTSILLTRRAATGLASSPSASPVA